MLNKKIVASSLLLGILFLPVSLFASDLDNWKDSLGLALPSSLKAQLCYKIGHSLRRLDPSTAQQYLNEGIEYLADKRLDTLMPRLLNTLGQTYRYQGYYHQALEYHQWAMRFEQDSLHKEVAPYTYLNLSLAYKKKGETAIAIPYQKSALLGFEAKGDLKMVANCYNNLGNIYRQIGDLSRAIEVHEMAMLIRSQIGDYKGLGFSYHNLGLIYQTMKMLNESEHFYNEAICLKDSLGKDNQVGSSYLNLGELFYARGDYRGARKFAEKSLRRFLLEENNAAVAAAYSDISRSYIAEGHLALAEPPIRKAISLTKRVQGPRYANAIGHYGRWLVKDGQVERGMDSLIRSLTILRTKESPLLQLSAYERLENSCKELGLAKDALFWAEQKQMLKDSVFKLQINAQLQAQEIQMELDQKKLEYVQLQEAMEKERLGYLWVGNGLIAAFLLAMGIVLAYRNRRQTEVNQILNAQNEKIAQANFDLRHANHEMEQVIHVLSHELKTPVRNVGGYVSLLRRRYLGQLDDEGQQFVKYAMNGVKSINQLLNDLLQYAQIGSKQSVGMGQVVISQVIARATQELMPQIEAYEAQLEVAPLPDLEVNYRAFYLVFRHLLDNALKFRKAGVPPIIKIGYRSEPGRHLFWVSDNGIGIEPAYQDQIFNLFQRLNPHEEKSGTGLGLAACRKIVRNYKGEIWVESTLGEGTTIFINLPDPNWRKSLTFGPFNGERFIAGTNM
ncbi:MAG: tetratricopeptide repeat protein [Bacteroidota bacterium]